MADKPLPTPDLLRQLLTYNPETGRLIWRHRPTIWFASGAQTAEVNALKWNRKHAGRPALDGVGARGYRGGSLAGKRVTAHRIIWAMVTGSYPETDIDHVNGDRADNRWKNLRLASRAENCRNSSGKKARNGKPASSRFCGVRWYHWTGKWAAQIRLPSGNKHLGYFETEEEAARAYDAAARLHHGEFARFNFPE